VAHTTLAVMAVPWYALHTGLLSAVSTPRAASASLLTFALLFGGGAWGMRAGGRGERSPLLLGLSLGAGLYAALRLIP
jgi:hypothetical protein